MTLLVASNPDDKPLLSSRSGILIASGRVSHHPTATCHNAPELTGAMSRIYNTKKTERRSA